MSRVLVIGATGAIGRYLLPRLLAAGHDVIALSRQPQRSHAERLTWQCADLHGNASSVPVCELVCSLGPLDAFAQWFCGLPWLPARVIAIGSMSIASKVDSPDAHERAIAVRLAAAEQALRTHAEARGCGWTILRPTLIYGAGLDRSLSPLARAGLRWRVFPHVMGATGLRQPVHAEDLAVACTAAAVHPNTIGRAYALGGGERLSVTAMLARVRDSLSVATLPVPLPIQALQSGSRLWPQRIPPGMVSRLRENLVADHAAASAEFGWTPRAFHPSIRDWRVPLLPDEQGPSEKISDARGDR